MNNTKKDAAGYSSCNGCGGYSHYTYANGEFNAYSNSNGDFMNGCSNATGANNMMNKSDAGAYATIVVDNNMPAAIKVLNNSGISTPLNATREQLATALHSLYNSNQKLFLSILKSVPYNASANNYTTRQIFSK